MVGLRVRLLRVIGLESGLVRVRVSQAAAHPTHHCQSGRLRTRGVEVVHVAVGVEALAAPTGKAELWAASEGAAEVAATRAAEVGWGGTVASRSIH